ncbi:hypothetical protein EGH21_04820 [Halomicroarcula sp. F13]|uniref:HNH endonuclease n=1 Tax=Haloarcula rubra TaxID=2487747 RepID=A0AAW4PNM4_9EURY|nr:hypothetical protein [Halomicroarcula rubra]MBX0322351.1 hypothetical protein [Halomicroarcula rubra]
MAECTNCKEESTHVWKHRRPTETTTHRTVEWLCARCHPGMSDTLRNEGA